MHSDANEIPESSVSASVWGGEEVALFQKYISKTSSLGSEGLIALNGT